jgi:murein L,D-transpeptidase YcbB/YkuD
MRLSRLAAVCLLVWTVGCGRGDLSAVSAAIVDVVAAAPIAPASASAWDAARAFYEAREHAPVWVRRDGPGPRVERAIAALRSAPAHGLDPARYGEPALVEAASALAGRDDETTALAADLAKLDVRITAALLFLGSDVALGRTPEKRGARPWKSRRPAPDLPASLAQAIDDDDLSDWLQAIAPPHPEYAALQKGLADLHLHQERGGWPGVPAARFAAGKSHRAVPALRQRLAATGELDPAAMASDVYDDQLRDAVRRFQSRHGLAADGIAGASTIAAMNVSVERRIRQVVVNLDRWRAMPDVLGARHLLVNIPAFHLYIREDGRPVKDIRVVVGKRGNETPVFSDEMETVVFSPYWNIPDTIVEGETAPAILRDPDYSRRNGLEILRQSRTGLTRVSADDVDWEDPEELRRLAIRQRPGPANALGHVKFLFPNEYSVYLHDTPSDQLFARPGRAFSHGCVRVEEPQALAEYVLGGLSDWTPERIAEAMHSGTEKHVKLPEPLPVHLVYFTVWPDETGGLRFHGDVYGHDRTHAASLRLG